MCSNKTEDFAGQAAHPLRTFIRTEAGSAGLLVVASVIALVWANSPWSDSYDVAVEHAVRAAVRLRRDRHGPAPLGQRRPDGRVLLRDRARGPPRAVGRRAHRPQPGGHPRRGRHRRDARARRCCTSCSTRRARRPGAGASSSAPTPRSCSACSRWSGPSVSTQLRIFLLTLTVIDDIVAVSVIGVIYSDSIATHAADRGRRLPGGPRGPGPGRGVAGRAVRRARRGAVARHPRVGPARLDRRHDRRAAGAGPGPDTARDGPRDAPVRGVPAVAAARRCSATRARA